MKTQKISKILILTSKDHLYSNFIIKNLFEINIFKDKKIIVLEQDSLIANKSKIKGLFHYLKISGPHYVIPQIIKQYVFLFFRFVGALLNNKRSPFYPYYLSNQDIYRATLNKLKKEKSKRIVRNIKPDLILSILSKEIIPKEIIEIPKYGCVNFHPAPIPFYRGVSPTFWCLANNDGAGATLHYIDTGIDTGKIIAQKKISIKNFKTEHSLYMRCAEVGTNLITDFLNKLDNNLKIKTLINPKEGSYHSFPSRQAVKNFLKQKYSFFKIQEFLFPNQKK